MPPRMNRKRSSLDTLGDQFFTAKQSADKFSAIVTKIRSEVKERLETEGDIRGDGGRHLETDEYDFNIEHRKSLAATSECEDYFKKHPDLLPLVTKTVFDARAIEDLNMRGVISDDDLAKLTEMKIVEATTIRMKNK